MSEGFDAIGLVVVRDGRVLCVRKSAAHRWIVPGGKQEAGEADVDTLKREVREELRCELREAKPLGRVVGPSPDAPGSAPDTSDGCREVRLWIGEIDGEPRACAEIAQVAWLALDHDRTQLARAGRWAFNHLQIERAKTKNGGWTKKTLAQWGVPWPPPKGWRDELESADGKR
jgi:8-oxo-dGTP diphosphatase